MPLERVARSNTGPHVDHGRIEGPDAALEAAADSVAALAAGVQAAYQAIASNPRYKPFVQKAEGDFPAALRHGSAAAVAA